MIVSLLTKDNDVTLTLQNLLKLGLIGHSFSLLCFVTFDFVLKHEHCHSTAEHGSK